MEATEAVRRLKSDLVNHCKTGKASRLRGLIVSPEVWSTLSEEEGFDGVVSVSGREGSRFIRYSFYVLENPNFPHSRSADPYFFVGYPEEVYETRYLGREGQILASGGRRSKQIGNVTFTELNPIAGVVEVKYMGGGRFYYDVDYDEVITVAEQSFAAGESPTALIGKTFADEWRVTNPPEWELNLDPKYYDYDRADVTSSVGRVFMQSEVQNRNIGYQLVGIGRNGFGEIVDVVLGDSRKTDPLEFARFALEFFLPEEIEEFLSIRGVTLAQDWKDGVDCHERWGQWHDPESLGRLTESVCYENSQDQGHRELTGSFLSTRAKSYRFGFTDKSVSNWEEFRSQHFPEGWNGWPKTDQDRAYASFAQSLAN